MCVWEVFKIQGFVRKRFHLSPPPLPPFYFRSRPIFRAGKTPKSPFFALCSTETLATQARNSLVVVLEHPHCLSFILPPKATFSSQSLRAYLTSSSSLSSWLLKLPINVALQRQKINRFKDVQIRWKQLGFPSCIWRECCLDYR